MNLRPGRYQCTVLAPTKGWLFEAGEKQTPYIRIPLVVSEGQQEGEEVVYQAWISEKSAARTIKNLREVFPEWDGDMMRIAKQSDDGDFVGQPCSIVVEEETEEYQGKTRKRCVIKWLNAPGGGDTLMEANKALQLAQRLMAQGESGGRQLPRKAAAKPTDDDDDIPF